MLKKALQLIIHPNSLLRTVCAPVKMVDDTTRQLIADMGEVMLANNGIGLAAPQVGVTERIIVVHTKEGVIPMINPEITKHSLTKETGEEGCLSIPDFFGPVKRYKKITVRFLDQDGENGQLEAVGLFARVIQHEIDHLNGVLFIDYLKAADVPEKYRE